jgi:hypothetical protein
MSDMDLQHAESSQPLTENTEDTGFLHLSEKQQTSQPQELQTVPAGTRPNSLAIVDRAGTIEHLAARQAFPPVDANAPETRQRLSDTRAEITRIVTGIRWDGLYVEDAAQRLLSLLNIGPVQQWKTIFIPFLLEIDRAGNLLPVWLHIIDHVEDPPVPPEANPAETSEGRARRYAILMLGNYKHPERANEKDPLRDFWQDAAGPITVSRLASILGRLAVDPNTSLYAVPALVTLNTNEATQALLQALKEARGWARVDIVDGILALGQARFYDIALASAFENVPGLENYVAIPLYRTLPLENYLRANTIAGPRLAQQAALVFAYVLQNNTVPPIPGSQDVPVLFERNLPARASALFEGTRYRPCWQNILALHRLGILLGKYWSEIARGVQYDPRISDAIQLCLPMMPEVEHWMAGPGRQTLLETAARPEEEVSLAPCIKILGEMREPRVADSILSYLESVRMLSGTQHALAIEAMCDALVRLGNKQALPYIQRALDNAVDMKRRASHPKQRDYLPAGDGDIPGSIVYAAALRTYGQFGAREMLSTIQAASTDLDPYVRSQALSALKQLDPQGEDMHSRLIARDLLNDPNDAIAASACLLVARYRDEEAVPSLRYLAETRTALAGAAREALRQLGQ